MQDRLNPDVDRGDVFARLHEEIRDATAGGVGIVQVLVGTLLAGADALDLDRDERGEFVRAFALDVAERAGNLGEVRDR